MGLWKGPVDTGLAERDVGRLDRAEGFLLIARAVGVLPGTGESARVFWWRSEVNCSGLMVEVKPR